MNWGMYGILVIFGAFVFLMILNPNLSCFGKRVSSPLYPLFRKKRQKKIKTEGYGFSLVDESEKQEPNQIKEGNKKDEVHSD